MEGELSPISRLVLSYFVRGRVGGVSGRRHPSGREVSWSLNTGNRGRHSGREIPRKRSIMRFERGRALLASKGLQIGVLVHMVTSQNNAILTEMGSCFFQVPAALNLQILENVAVAFGVLWRVKKASFRVLGHILISQNEAILTEIGSSPLHLQHTCTLQNLENAGSGGVLQ